VLRTNYEDESMDKVQQLFTYEIICSNCFMLCVTAGRGLRNGGWS